METNTLFDYMYIYRSYKLALLLPLWMAICFILSKFRATRQLLLKYPHIFTDGYITHQEPAEANKNAIQFIYVVKAKGWYKSSPHEPDPVTELHIQITTIDNPYAVTSKAMLLCGKVMLQQKDKMPAKYVSQKTNTYCRSFAGIVA